MNEKKNQDLYYACRDWLLDNFERSDVIRAEYMHFSDLELVKVEEVHGQKEYIDYYFNMREYYSYYSQTIRRIKNGGVVSVSCSCEKFRSTHSCIHIIGCFKNYTYDLLYSKPDLKELSEKLIDTFAEMNKPVIKKEVFLEVELEDAVNTYHYYKGKAYSIRVKVGIDKMYSYNHKQTSFINYIKGGDVSEFSFGKDFTFDFTHNYFNDTNLKVFKYINKFIPDLKDGEIGEERLVDLLDLFKDLKFSFKFNDKNIKCIKEGFPLSNNINKLDDDNYKLEFDIKDLSLIGNNYVYYDNDIYSVSNKEMNLISVLVGTEVKELIVPKTKLKDFSYGILPIIKKNTKVEDDIKNEIAIVNEPDVSLYFDLNKNNVVLNIKLKYNEEIDYFDNKSSVLRDVNFESELVNKISSYGFIIDKNKFIINDLELMVNLVENGLNELSNLYNVYTTENFKKLNIKNKLSMSSTFSIGKDNILTYNFNLDGVDSDELVNIFKSIKDKKKYYKLKNNSIIDLEDENLNEMLNMTEELDFSDDEIINGKGEILKYRAIYLDSIDNNVVKKDGLFNSFIENFYENKNGNISLTSEDKEVLRDYQITAVKWLYNLDKTGFGGVLADEMGLGKTIELIYYIKEVLKTDIDANFLIIVPTSLLYNWKYEFNKFAPSIKVKVINGLKSKRSDLLMNGNFDVYITTYGLLREDEEIYKNLKFHAVILDEAQSIKNPIAGITKACKNIKADVKFALTGTPIENSLIELWSIFDFIMPGYLSKFDKFNRKYKVREFDEDTNMLLSNLSKQIKPFILRRRKKDVIKELPSKIENNIFIDLSDEQKKLYVSELNKVKEEIEKAIEDGGMSKVRFILLPLLTKLRQICIDPKIVYDDYKGGSNKVDRFMSIVEEVTNNGHKVLVFTSFRSALNVVKEKLEEIGICSYVIDGSVSSKERIERVNDFNQNDDVKVFLIMLKSGGVGLNLTGADIVIHLDLWWNPQAENQATDRAHRIGQKNTVEVIRLVSKGTIEEKVLELQEKKKELSNRIIDSSDLDKNVLSELTENDIKNLLAYENR